MSPPHSDSGDDTPRSASSQPSLPSLAARVDLDSLAFLACLARRQGSSATNTYTCEVLQPPKAGSYNLVYTLLFTDGVKWVARLPVEEWNAFQEHRMTLDVFTLQFLATHTSLPIPHVYSHSTTLDNPLARPYMFMSFVEGKKLSKLWFDPSWMTDQRRRTVFESLATTMSQLGNLTFPKIGQLTPDPAAGGFAVGPIYPSTDQISDGATSDDAVGPYESAYDYLLDRITREANKLDSTTSLSELALLRLLAGSLPDHRLAPPPFVLSFPDYGYQNIFVDDDGHVSGLIDWDGTTIGPRQGGFARYPSWITRDWDPVMYAWPTVYDEDSSDDHDLGSSDEQARHRPSREELEEDSPETLQRFRDEYLEIYTKVDPANAGVTRDSHVFEAIEIAIGATYTRPEILAKLTEYVFGIEGRLGGGLTFVPLSKGISKGSWLKDMVGAEKVASGGEYVE